MTPSPPKTFLTVTTAGSSSSISSSSSSSSSTNSTSSSSSSSSGPAFSATPAPFPLLAHARFGLGDLTDGLGSILWGDLTSDTTQLAPSTAEPTTATTTKTTLSSEDAPVPSTGEATADASSTKAAAASTAPVSLSTVSIATLATTTITTTTTTTPSASPLSSPLPPSPSTTGHEALVAFASSAPSTSASNGNSTGGGGGLRPGDLAGITIAAHVVLTVFIGLGLWHYRRKYRQLRDKEQQRERQSRTAAALTGSTAYDDDDMDMMASRKTASSSTILEMKRLRTAGGGSRGASQGSLSALELLEPGNSPGLMSGGGQRQGHRGAAVPLTPSYTITPDESPIIRPPSPIRLKGSDLRWKKPNLHMMDMPNEPQHAASIAAINKNNHLFQGEDDDDDENDDDDDDTSSSCYHYAEVTDDGPGGFGGGPTRSPLLHLPNLSFHTLDLMAERPAVKAVKRYSVASPIRSPVPPSGFSAPDSVYSGRGSVRFPWVVASVAGSVVGRKSDEEEDDDENDDEAEDGASHDESRGGGTHDDDAGARDKTQGVGAGGAVRGGLRTLGGPQSPKSPPKILLYPKPYKGW